VINWLPRVMVGLSLVLAVAAATDRRPVATLLWLAAAVFWLWRACARVATPAPVPPHVDEQWARQVLAVAGTPRGVPAVKALRRAEPAIPLLDAKLLVDRIS
jgi:hypothetical protein